MKKVYSLFVLLFTILLSGCSLDDGSITSANLLATGASANDFLSNENFDKLLIEIAYVPGFRPTDETIDNFRGFLEYVTYKEDIEFKFLALPSPNEESLTIQEIVALEDENRTAYNEGTTLAVYAYFSDASSNSDTGSRVILGTAYRNTSIIMFEPTIRKSARNNTQVSITDVETATVNHEFGHLFGLVNLGTPPINPDHEEAQNKKHCNAAGCLMRANLEFGHSSTEMTGCNIAEGMTAVPVLDPECIRDLQIKGARCTSH